MTSWQRIASGLFGLACIASGLYCFVHELEGGPYGLGFGVAALVLAIRGEPRQSSPPDLSDSFWTIGRDKGPACLICAARGPAICDKCRRECGG
jgi:hypothetical protein